MKSVCFRLALFEKLGSLTWWNTVKYIFSLLTHSQKFLFYLDLIGSTFQRLASLQGSCIEFSTFMTQSFFGRLQELVYWLFREMLWTVILPIHAIFDILSHGNNTRAYLHHVLLTLPVQVNVGCNSQVFFGCLGFGSLNYSLLKYL